jgi:uncharacterized protein YjeT (DUF2065 family)
VIKGKNMIGFLLIMFWVAIYFYIGGYCLLFPKKFKTKLETMKNAEVRFWGGVVLFAGLLIVLLLLKGNLMLKLFRAILE